MSQSKRDVKLGRFLSLVLRHNPSAAGIALDPNGWADVDQLLAGMNRAGRRITREDLERIVRENDKSRYRFSGDAKRIRANQGHSLAVDVELPQAEPPEILYHGTATRFLENIIREGIRPGTRQHVHLSGDPATAVDVGGRHGIPVVLPVEAGNMHRDGYCFFRSENGVWLCGCVPPAYIGAPHDPDGSKAGGIL